MATKTKNKLSKALKNTFINELKDKKEEERLERVKENSNLREIIAYVNLKDKFCNDTLNLLDEEGVKPIIKDITDLKNEKEWKEVISITNLNTSPVFYVNGEYLIYKRDFQNSLHALNALRFLGNPDFVNPSSDKKLHENLKTNQYNLYQRFIQLDNKLKPLLTFITNLQKELEEEDTNSESIPEVTKEGDCGCGKNKK